MALNTHKYWEERISENGFYSSIGHQAYGEFVNKVRKENTFSNLDEILDKEFSSQKNKSLLDVGCGTGIYSKYYSEKVDKLYGLDISKSAIDEVRKQDISGDFEVGEILDICLGEKFDIVHCFSVLYHIIDDKKWKDTLNEIYNATSNGGIIILRISWIEEDENPADHVKRRSKDKYKDFFESKNLEIIDYYDVYDVPRFETDIPIFKLSYMSARLGLFKKNQKEKIVVLKK